MASISFLYLYLFIARVALAVGTHEQHARGGHHESDPVYENLNTDLAHYSLIAFGGLAAIVFVWSTWFRFVRYVRRLVTFDNERQHYFARPYKPLAILKAHLINAPLFSKRHNNEFRLSRAVNMGTLPSRFETFLIVGLLGMNFGLCVFGIPYATSTDPTADLVRNRLGTMASVNLVPLVLFASRNNPLISLLQIPFDTFNLLHRWLARIVVCEALAHGLSWCIPKVSEASWEVVGSAIKESTFIRSGLVTLCAFTGLLLHSPSPIRHAFYEVFLHLHIAMVSVSFVFLWVHLKGRVPQTYLLTAIILWATERTFRLLTILYRNWSLSLTTASIETLPGDAVKVSLYMPHPWTFKPGQHLFLCIPAVGWWTFHPFSICWVEKEDGPQHGRRTRVSTSLLIRRRTGFTDTLFHRAKRSMNCHITLPAIVEGPYGGNNTMNLMESYGTILLFAAGIGITHQIPFVQHLVQGYADGTASVRRLTLVWVIRTPDHLDWVQEWMAQILEMDDCHAVLKIRVFITLPLLCDIKEIPWLGDTSVPVVEMLPGRPDIEMLVRKEASSQVGAMGVLSCGTGCFSDDVRSACRRVQGSSQIDFIEESFTW